MSTKKKIPLRTEDKQGRIRSECIDCLYRKFKTDKPSKADIPLNVPVVCLIENPRSILKGKVYKKQNISTIRLTQITKCLKEVDIELVKDLTGSTRLRIIRTNGLIEKKLIMY